MKLSTYAILMASSFLGIEAAEPVVVVQPKSPTLEQRKNDSKYKDPVSRVTRQISFEKKLGRPAYDGINQLNKQKTEKRSN